MLYKGSDSCLNCPRKTCVYDDYDNKENSIKEVGPVVAISEKKIHYFSKLKNGCEWVINEKLTKLKYNNVDKAIRKSLEYGVQAYGFRWKQILSNTEISRYKSDSGNIYSVKRVFSDAKRWFISVYNNKNGERKLYKNEYYSRDLAQTILDNYADEHNIRYLDGNYTENISLFS